MDKEEIKKDFIKQPRHSKEYRGCFYAGGLKNVEFAYVLLYRVFDNDVCSYRTSKLLTTPLFRQHCRS